MTGSDASVGILFVNRTDSLCHGGHGYDTGRRAREAPDHGAVLRKDYSNTSRPRGWAVRAWSTSGDRRPRLERDRACDRSLTFAKLAGDGAPGTGRQGDFDGPASMHQVAHGAVRGGPIRVSHEMHEAHAVASDHFRPTVGAVGADRLVGSQRVVGVHEIITVTWSAGDAIRIIAVRPGIQVVGSPRRVRRSPSSRRWISRNSASERSTVSEPSGRSTAGGRAPSTWRRRSTTVSRNQSSSVAAWVATVARSIVATKSSEKIAARAEALPTTAASET